MKLDSYPGWKNINPFKKRAHLLKLYLAKQYGKFIQGSKIVFIAGALGKTTTLVCARAILSSKLNVVSSNEKDISNSPVTKLLNLADAILQIKPKTYKALLEINPTTTFEVDLINDLIKSKTLVVTKLSEIKESDFDGLESKGDVSLRLLKNIPKDGVVILNWDDPLTRKLQEKTEASSIFFGFDEKNCHVWAGNMKIVGFQTHFELNYGVERVEVRSKLLGFHQIYPMLAAASLALNFNSSLISVKKGLEKVEPQSGKMEVLTGYNGATIINDTYEGSYNAFEEALETLNQIPARRRIVVLGELDTEGGALGEKMHREIARILYKNKVDLVLLGTGFAKYVSDELDKLGFIPERKLFDLQNPGMVSNLLKILARGDVVLIKGSASLKLSEVVKKITKD